MRQLDFITHLGFTVALVTVDYLAAAGSSKEVYVAAFVGGVLLDADKVFEIADTHLRARKNQIPDITARWRVLHSLLAIPFGIVLSLLVASPLPFLAVYLHLLLDCFVPGLEYQGRWYSSHSPLKLVALPFSKKWWGIVTTGWPVVYPPKLNWVYTRVMPAMACALLVLSALAFAGDYLLR